MSERVAVRNLRLCTKECICLYVCPTGASDTENSIIDTEKCIGCGRCAEACGSGAISLVPLQYPKQQTHSEEVINEMRIMLRRKADAENTAAALAGRLAKALEKSNRVMAEDLIREAGYMLPQSRNTHNLLLKTAKGSAAETAEKLLEMLDVNE